MTADQRTQIRDAARYLRDVRPIDPEAMVDYVEGQPHPGTVRTVLRELATDVGLVEASDGTFRPAPSKSVTPTETPVEGLPEAYDHELADVLAETRGPRWYDGDAGDALREQIRRLKADYHDQRGVAYDDATASAYAVYHLANYYVATSDLVTMLAAQGRLEVPITVLDVGAGVGGPALALLDALPPDALVDYHAVEPGAGADIFERLLDVEGDESTSRRNVHVTIHRTPVEDLDLDGLTAPETDRDDRGVGPAGGFDLVLAANVLSEVDEPVATLERCYDALAEDGTLLATAPAEERTATALRRYERALADDGPATVFAPTVRLWPDATPTGECWSFDEGPALQTPTVQRRLADAAGPDEDPSAYVNTDVRYAYSVLVADGATAIDARGDRSTVARMADSEGAVTERVDYFAVKLSNDLSDGDNAVYLIGDGSESVDHFAVCTEQTVLNDDLESAAYGDFLAISKGLVLWNDDEDAYNVVVDGETTVDAAPGVRVGPARRR